MCSVLHAFSQLLSHRSLKYALWSSCVQKHSLQPAGSLLWWSEATEEGRRERESERERETEGIGKRETEGRKGVQGWRAGWHSLSIHQASSLSQEKRWKLREREREREWERERETERRESSQEMEPDKCREENEGDRHPGWLKRVEKKEVK